MRNGAGHDDLKTTIVDCWCDDVDEGTNDDDGDHDHNGDDDHGDNDDDGDDDTPGHLLLDVFVAN